MILLLLLLLCVKCSDVHQHTPIKVMLLGPSSSGKTTFLHRLMGKPIEKPPSTMSIKIFEKTIHYNTQILVFKLWDTAGAEKLYGTNLQYSAATNTAIFFFDATSQESYTKCLEMADSFPPKAQKILVKTKIDQVQKIPAGGIERRTVLLL